MMKKAVMLAASTMLAGAAYAQQGIGVGTINVSTMGCVSPMQVMTANCIGVRIPSGTEVAVMYGGANDTVCVTPDIASVVSGTRRMDQCGWVARHMVDMKEEFTQQQKPVAQGYTVLNPGKPFENLFDLFKAITKDGRATARWVYIVKMSADQCGYRFNESLTTTMVNQMLTDRRDLSDVGPQLTRLSRVSDPKKTGSKAITEFAEAMEYNKTATCEAALRLWGPDGEHIDHLIEKR
jgi:hypothetical protein